MKELRHNIDPATSHEAIRRHTKSGKRLSNLEKVYLAVQTFPGRTANELTEHLPGFEYIEVRRRLTDLKNKERVRQGAVRTCAVRGTEMVTWYSLVPKTNLTLFA